MDTVALNRFSRHRFLRIAICTIAALAAILAMFCWRLRVHSVHDLEAYVGMAMECHPVWQDLALRRVYHGQSVDEAIANSNPVTVVRHGRFVELGYEEPLSFTQIHVIAMDGKLNSSSAGA